MSVRSANFIRRRITYVYCSINITVRIFSLSSDIARFMFPRDALL
jgi:hypothetical protein